jgi:hypothetical protein
MVGDKKTTKQQQQKTLGRNRGIPKTQLGFSLDQYLFFILLFNGSFEANGNWLRKCVSLLTRPLLNFEIYLNQKWVRLMGQNKTNALIKRKTSSFFIFMQA